MSIYRFSDSSIIQEIAVRKSAGGGVRSFLYLGANVSPDQITGIKNTLKEQRWHSVPTEAEGRYCLEVRGARNIEHLEKVLLDGKFIPSAHTSIIVDDEKISIKEKFRSNMLFSYGIINVFADLGMLGYGLLKQKLEPEIKPWEDTAAAIAYGAGSLTFFGFGHGDKSDHQLRAIAAKLRVELQSKGLEVASNGSVDSFTIHHRRDINALKRFLSKYSSSVGNGFTALAGAFIAKGAFKSNNPTTFRTDSLLGASTIIGGTTAALVKEKAPDPSRPQPKGVFGRIGRWIQERPNRVAGIGYGISTLFHASEVVNNITRAKKEYGPMGKAGLAYWAYGMRGVFVGLNVIGEIILTLSSKGHGSGVKSDESVDETAYALVADAISHQPMALRERLFTDLSRDFLAKPDVLGGNAKEIETALRARVERLSANPWAITVPARNIKTDTQMPKEDTLWRGKFPPSQAAAPAAAPPSYSERVAPAASMARTI